MRMSFNFHLIAAFLFCLLFRTLSAQTDYSRYVDPFIGTGGHGHTYPGATVPFGMVQLSPDTRLDGWDGCSAYHYSDSIVYGFSHTHLSGTGCSDYGDILLIPVTGETSWKNTDYASGFSHASEKASPGYYAVTLEKYKIKAELTTTKRCGFHKYLFPKADNAGFLIDLKHRDVVIESNMEIIGKNEIRGLRRSKAWADDQYVYFVIRFSKDFDSYLLSENDLPLPGKAKADGHALKARTYFKAVEGEVIYAKVGISAVSVEGALKNLEAEIPVWNFDEIRDKAKAEWNKELSKIEVEGEEENKIVFYSALYHTMVVPNLYMDVDGQYRGRDLKIHQANGFDYYSVFSLWDTYRAANPLYTIIDPKRTCDFINTFLLQYEQGGLLPVWELSANETNCMIGYHAVPVIVDAFTKGISGFDIRIAFDAMKTSAMQDKRGLKEYRKYGYVPGDMESEDVSKTLEYAYDDWCIAQMANKLGRKSDYRDYIRRAQSYKNLFDPVTGFMRPKVNACWYAPFEPTEVNNHYTEANAYQYSFYVPQDLTTYMNLQGGKDGFAKKLDELFTTQSKLSGRDQADITGMIGQYAHGNEPSHHMAYLYDYAGRPWKTQELVHKIMQDFYLYNPDGLIGNEDCGQMSAWYVLSSMGFYPVCPGQAQYAIGTPNFDKVTIHLAGGKTFVITAKNLNARNFYIKSAQLYGTSYTKSYLTHKDILMAGGITFEMQAEPDKQWGSGENDVPTTIISDNLILPVPYIDAPGRTFKVSLTFSLKSIDPKAKIYYTLDGGEPDSTKSLYLTPITINANTNVKAIACRSGKDYSNPISAKFIKINPNRKVTLNTPYENQYTGGGPDGLVDGIRGNIDWRLGYWQGYLQQDFDAILDLGKMEAIKHIALGCLQDTRSWIWFPKFVDISVSEDGKTYRDIANIKNDIPDTDENPLIHDFGWDVRTGRDLSVQIRYIKIYAKNYGKCPSWHPGAGGDGHLFVDEIVVE